MTEAKELVGISAIKKTVKIWLLYDLSANGGPFSRLPQKYKMLTESLNELGLEVDYVANLHKWQQAFETGMPLSDPLAMAGLQDAHSLAAKFVHKVVREKPDLILLDSQSQLGLSIAMSAFYLKVPMVYIDAGHRRHHYDHYHMHQMHKRLICNLSQFHFCQTLEQSHNLHLEGLVAHVQVTGDLLIDDALKSIRNEENLDIGSAGEGDSIPLVVLDATKDLESEPLAPLMMYKAAEILAGGKFNCRVILLTTPKDYAVLRMNSGLVTCMPFPGFETFYNLVKGAHVFVTQCEAHQGVLPSLQVPVLMVGQSELWPESQVCGTSFYSPDSPQSIAQAVDQLIKRKPFEGAKTSQNPFGQGNAGQIMAKSIQELCTLYF